MRFEFEDTDLYLAATVSGNYSLAGMRELIERLADESAQRKIERALVDVSAMVGHASSSDRFSYAEYAALMLGPVLRKCAACAGAGQKLVPYTAVVAQNRGFSLQVFRDRVDAIRWLIADADHGPLVVARTK